MNNVVALDFDGVVWDSVDEAFEQAWRAWCECVREPAIDKALLRRKFREARWQCKDGHDFFVVMTHLARLPEVDMGAMEAEDFRRLRDTMTRGEDAEAFVRAFYQHRTRMRDNDFATWMALQRPFPGVAEEIERLRREVSAVTIATTKDAPSARRLLESIGISGVPIFGREVSLDKADHMRAMAAQYQVGTKDIVFVDDLLENLLPLRELGVRLVLAGWGYNTSAERARAAAVGVAVAPLNGLADTVLDVLAA